MLFDGRPVVHPAALAGMRDRTVTVGAPSFEQRMIAWRIGWVVAPRGFDGLPAVRPAGAWSLLLDVAALGLDCVEVSERLLAEKVTATPMRGWGGDVAGRHVRFVFSNEPVERLAVLGDRVRRALTPQA